MKIGDILYCKKDFHCIYYGFSCKVGERVIITRFDYNNNLIVAYEIKNSNGQITWVILKRFEYTMTELKDTWDYFYTKIERVRNRIKQYESRRYINMYKG